MTSNKSELELLQKEKAVLVVVDPSDFREAEANSEEMRLLCESADVLVEDEIHFHRASPDPRYYLGKGHAEDIFLSVQDTGAEVVVVSENLSASQQRNVEDVVTVEVVDRTQLILNIFAKRARTSEGKLQVELAQLRYLLPRLAGKGAQMSRLGGASSSGGIATRGPGETKLETDRRRVRKRVSVLEDELEQVVKHRVTQNKARAKLLIPGAALVGYTSAGKSTLLNLLAHAEVEAHARLFATLDPTTRRVDLSNGTSFILSDTVGFIRNLPHHLVAAFRATMEEVTDADFLIHVIDASHPFRDEQQKAVEKVLTELGVQGKPMITVYNKSDAIKDQYELRRLIAETENSCYISALTGEGLQYLEDMIRKVVSSMLHRTRALLPYDRGDLVALFHERGRVITSEYRSDGIYLEAELPPDIAARVKQYSLDAPIRQE